MFGCEVVGATEPIFFSDGGRTSPRLFPGKGERAFNQAERSPGTTVHATWHICVNARKDRASSIRRALRCPRPNRSQRQGNHTVCPTSVVNGRRQAGGGEHN